MNLMPTIYAESVTPNELVGKLFYYEFSHAAAHLQGERNFTPNSLIYKDKSTFI